MSPPRSERNVVDAFVIRKLVEDPFVVKKLVELLFVVDALVAKKLDEVAFVIRKLVEDPFVVKKLVELLFVVDALVAKKLVAVALAAIKLVVLASVKYPLTAVIPVVDALVSTDDDAKMFCVKVFKKRSVEEPSENDASADGVVFPAIWSLSVGAATPIPMFPLARMVKSEDPVEDATLNGLSAVEVDDCTLNANKDEVALIPVTTPLSMSVDSPSVVEESQRVAYPAVPPATPPAVILNPVAHLVDVPVLLSIIPDDPNESDES